MLFLGETATLFRRVCGVHYVRWQVELAPQSLNIPLRRRSWSPLKIAAVSMLVGWLWHRPMELAQILVSCLLGGAGVWSFLASPLIWRLITHRIPIVRGISVILAVGGVVTFMTKVVPYIHGLVA